MKNVFFILALLLSLSAQAQSSDYAYENCGLNIFVDVDGTANKNFQLGGPTFVIGSQLTPNFFIGGGAAWKAGCMKSKYIDSKYYEIYWRSPEGKDILGYYVMMLPLAAVGCKQIFDWMAKCRVIVNER